ncbi:MAG TPA: HAD-IIIC family phosphatase [Candidatus Acidoferrales bacterium]|nr:HAD-IIIC family phosphatase [Candidatus Acidoferrales bacterium]
MVRVNCPGSVNGYVIKIRFKQWGKLWSEGSIRLHLRDQADRIEQRDYNIGKVLQSLVMLSPARSFLSAKRYSFKKRIARRAKPAKKVPTAFLVECFNPGANCINLSLTIRSNNPSRKIPFQELLAAKPGPSRFRVSYDSINAVVALSESFQIELIPNDVPDGTTLYFGAMDFVHERTPPSEKESSRQNISELKPQKVKCVVWDLDNTLWEGILIEDGPEKLRLKNGIRRIIEELDRRGILLSIASKNNHHEAMQMLKSWNLEEYFLLPQIAWNPKSEGVAAIATGLNIGVDAILFIDDSEFEREQVHAVLPTVQMLDARDYQSLLDLPELSAPLTEESSNRRKMYRMEHERQKTAEGFGQDYLAFLRYCAIRVALRPMDQENLERVHELTQRTNQMNFSGNRYDRKRLAEILKAPHLETYVIKCDDRFGSYGVVGFAIVDTREPRLTDLMFSCRVQSKRVEHAFLSHIIRKYTSDLRPNFHANYRKTPRNAPSGKAFEDIGFIERECVDGVSRLVVSRQKLALEDGIIKIVESEETARVK